MSCSAQGCLAPPANSFKRVSTDVPKASNFNKAFSSARTCELAYHFGQIRRRFMNSTLPNRSRSVRARSLTCNPPVVEASQVATRTFAAQAVAAIHLNDLVCPYSSFNTIGLPAWPTMQDLAPPSSEQRTPLAAQLPLGAQVEKRKKARILRRYYKSWLHSASPAAARPTFLLDVETFQWFRP